MAHERITLLKIPVDIIAPEDMEQEILSLLEKNEPSQIVLLSLRDLMRARINTEYRNIINNASLVLPISKSIVNAAIFLKETKPIRYNTFNFIIQILGILESHYKSAYLFGTRKKSLLKAEKNVKITFPNLHLVGRCAGYYPKNIEKNIISAIYKATPSVVLFSSGIPGKERWFYRNRKSFGKGIFIWNNDVIDIFAKRKNRIPENLFNLGWEFLLELVKNPLKIFFVFQYLWFKIILVYYRLFRLKNNKNQQETC